MKKILYIIAAGAMMLTGCSKESETNEGGEKGTPLAITVSVANPTGMETRATDNGYATTFDTDDAIGIWAYDGVTCVAQNIKWVRQADGTWKPANTADNIYYNGNPLTIKAYFPYDATATALPEAATFVVQADQSTLDAYRNSDLLRNADLTWNGAKTAQQLTFIHAMAMVEASPTSTNGLESVTLDAKLSAADATATPVTLFPFADGSYRAVLPTQTLNTSIGFSYNLPAFYSYTVNKAITAGQYTRFEIKTTADVGNFYYSDGSYSKELDANKTCVGIVFRPKTTWMKGLVVSLTDNNANIKWGTQRGVVTNATSETNGADNMSTIQTYLADYNDNWSLYPAFEWCYNYGLGTPFEHQWYLPAKNELQTLYAAYCGKTYVPWAADAVGPDYGDVTQAKADFNDKLTTAGGTVFNLDRYHWSSTESNSDGAYRVYFLEGKTYSGTKILDSQRIRAVLAF